MTAGTRVRMKASWLKQIGTPPTDDLWRLQGTVVGSKLIDRQTLVRVQWDGEDMPKSSFAAHLQPIGTPEPF